MTYLQQNFYKKLYCMLATCFGRLLLVEFFCGFVFVRVCSVLFNLPLFIKANFLPAHYIKKQA